MARNEEKALTLFSKWNTFKKDFHASSTNRRPLLSNDVSSLPDAEKHRRDIVAEVTRKISAIQNASLGEPRIRELNDEINVMMKKKHYWEIRIRELGGGDYKAKGKQILDIEGKELPGVRGYRYYGVAKDLPGVRELFTEHKEEGILKKRNRVDLYKTITPDYYGFRDDDDGILVEEESIREKELIAITLEEYESKKLRLKQDMQRSGGVFGREEYDQLIQKEMEDDEEEIKKQLLLQSSSLLLLSTHETSANVIVAPAAEIPSQDEIAEFIVEKRKQSILDTYLL